MSKVVAVVSLLCSLTTDADIDGAYFGTTFPHFFLMTYPYIKPAKPTQSYVPRIFGFKIHKSAQ
jgi:casein kinase II subunit beta